MKNELFQQLKYIFWDALAAIGAYTTLYIYRKLVIESHPGPLEFSPAYYLGLVLIPVFWVTIYLITGFYKDIYRRSRLKELIYTFNASLLGSIFIFFTLLLDDTVATYKDYYRGFLVYFGAHFLLTAFFRFLLSSRTAHRIRQEKLSFNTLLIGSNAKAAELYHELTSSKIKLGNKFVGFASVNNNIKFLVEKKLPHLGTYKELNTIIQNKKVEEVIIAIESSEHEKLESIVNNLEGCRVIIKMIPDTYDIISGKVRMESLASVPLVEINHQLMPLWQRVLKRFLDAVVSLLVLILLSPLYLTLYVITKLSDPGPGFYYQSRIGLHGKEFKMIKFRSMTVNAEKQGPQLSSENDNRMTAWGGFMRKYRLDELPQFINVIKGDMSIVGPRPERQYYIDQISKKAPHYKHLQKVKPGITSWGMVKFGYAENVDEMVKRLKYDIIYIENMNLFNDLKVLIYTVLIVLQGRGK
jgi:exopolysaccharide biosynthesis polyprenyl glycosylphosphotransferase